jgi:ribosomal protein S18 acetylase RimI-like enzyme
MDYQVRPLEENDIKQAVNVHMAAFPSFFLTFLGPKFLMHFYRSFREDPAGIGFVAVDPQTRAVVGVVVGPLVPDGYFKRLLKRKWWAFCLASLKAVLKKPSICKRLFRAVFYRGEVPEGPKRALLSSIAVSPDCQKGGVGRALVNRWVQEVAARGGTGCFLTTDADGNEKVNAFYQRLGWTVESAFTTPEGRRMNRYIHNIKD